MSYVLEHEHGFISNNIIYLHCDTTEIEDAMRYMSLEEAENARAAWLDSALSYVHGIGDTLRVLEVE